jgi:uncharacterized membrane protein YphA (DoxX/SURF4 family)
MANNNIQQIDDVHGSGIYPAGVPLPSGRTTVRTAGQLGHPEAWRKSSLTAQTLEKAALVTGRAIYGGYFLYSGINHFLNRKALAAYARTKGVPAPDASVVATGLLIATGGASILLGLRPKLGAGLISGFLLGVSPKMHAFWEEREPQQRMHEMVNFTKNMALVGASLFAAAYPEPWPWRAPAPRGSEALMLLR